MQFSVATAIALLCACMTTSFAFSDVDILNFALNLECLEAEFYSWAALGHGLTAAQRGSGPLSTGGRKANLGDYQAVAEEIAAHEIEHVVLLRGALGAAAVPCPQIDIGSAFAAAANGALNTTLSPPFSPYSDQLHFLLGALLFEDVGVMAYNGAIGVIRSPAYAAVARGVMAVEAYHAGIVRTLLSQDSAIAVQPYGVPASAILIAISEAIDGLLALDRDQPVGALNGKPNLAPVNSMALAYAVSPSAVINVVYGSSTATKGGFFPAGINGLFGKTRGMLTDVCTGAGKAMRYKQCGGTSYSGPTCCEQYNTCVMKSAYYSQCEPSMLPAGLVPWYGQCGGKAWTKSSTCEPMSTCVWVNDFYSQCRPMSG